MNVELAIGEILSYTTGSINYTVSGLTPFTTYFFSVAAVTVGVGPATDRIEIQTNTARRFHTHFNIDSH